MHGLDLNASLEVWMLDNMRVLFQLDIIVLYVH